jgi:ubiquinone/menaquinone biosynthesis C-methylase UbiE
MPCHKILTGTHAVSRTTRLRRHERDYRPFPNETGRNTRQVTIEVPLMVRALGLPTGGRVLEVGCGRGVAIPVLARLLRPRRLTGLDLDPTLLDEARAHADAEGIAVELVPGDVRCMPFPDGAFDLVVDFGTCYHIARAAEALAEIARVLAPGGLFVHETPLSQLFAHPFRSFGRRMPRPFSMGFERHTAALLWAARRRLAEPA